MVTRQRKGKIKPGKVVWRISASAPLGEYVHTVEEREVVSDSQAEPEPVVKAEAPTGEIPERGWHHSSHELVRGMDMSEEPLDTLPDDLFDQFFKKEP